MSEWQKIDNARRDGTPYDLYRPRAAFGTWDQRITAAWFQFDEGYGSWVWPDQARYDGWWDDLEALISSGKFYEDNKNFTHFRSVPDPPEQD